MSVTSSSGGSDWSRAEYLNAHSRFGHLVNGFDFTQYPNLVVSILPSLDLVHADHAEQWALHPRIRRYREGLEHTAPWRLYVDPIFANGKEAFMEDLIDRTPSSSE